MAGLPKAGVQLVAEGAQAFAGDLGAGEKAVKSFVDVTEQGGKGVSAFGEIAKGALRSVGTAAVDFAAQGVKAIGGFFVDSVKQAGDFESGMNRFASVTGSAIAEAGMELSDFSDLFLKLGADTQFSAAQAQEAAVNLAKGGLDPATIAGGALADTLTLAAAGELELGAAAEITAKQLGVWASAGVTSAQVANLLAQAANASTVDVDELALGLANVGGIAKVAGLSFQETVQAMALLAPGFSSAADAGTSFKTFLTRLQPTTVDATKAMADLNLLTEEGKSKFYDATGSFIGMGAAADLLKGSLEGMSEADRVAALQAVFGSDAFRAAALIAEQGAAGYDAMGAAMTGAGTAAEQAAMRNQGFAFALESMMGSIDTFKIVLGTALLPLLTSLINDALIPGINAVMTWSQSILGAADPMAALVTSINSVLPGFASFVAFVQGAIDATQPLIDLMGGNLVPILAAVATVLGGALLVALGGVVASFLAVAAPVAAAVAALAILYANIGPIQDALKRFGDTEWGQALQRGAQVAANYFTGAFVTEISAGAGVVQSKLAELGASSWGQDLQRGAQVAGNYFTGPFASELAAGVGVVQGKLNELAASNWWQTLVRGAQVAADMYRQYMTAILQAVTTALTSVASFVQSHSSQLQTIISGAWQTIVTVVTTAMQTLLGAVTAALQALTGDWTGAWNTIKATTSTLVAGIVTVISTNLEMIPAVVSTTFDAVIAVLSGLVGQFSEAGANMIEGLADGIRSAASSAINAAVSVATDALSAVQDALGMHSPSRVAAEEIGTPFVMGIVEGIEESADLLMDMARQLSEQLVDDMALVGEAAAEAFKDMFTGGLEGTASIARQKVKNLRDTDKLAKTATKEEDPYKRDQLEMITGSAQQQLSDAETFAATFADPKLGAKYFKEESARIIELAELKHQYIQATTAAEQAALTKQMRLIEAAQKAERTLFDATAAEQSKTFDKTAESLQVVLDKLRHEAQRDLGISKLDIGKENQASAYAEYLQDVEAIKKIEALLATITTPIKTVSQTATASQIAAGTGARSTTNTSNWNFSYMTQQSMGSVQQDIAIAQALAGV